ncbi:DUF3540 domain-containing protein [Neoroseomonas oryzicola]|uniref:DUF3540 domain-containing protein n=1 Tax=Neoroseomonas oryzicola TaxID=535904 RepID=A0A9X9WJ51_9PROT|nr:DUF3540 domain-containing protein [Neoroseomonas oryzicola]MBR0660361.1 DUF3540 domain-containing protein [Neoroseomonas oryzicola]NKE18351.1 DUF3540 domain-containing protein [Neoroseomonas oryzicola]
MNAMTGIAQQIGAATDSAEVLACDGASVLLLREGQEERAGRAFSCLVEPAPGDLVLVGRAGGQAYVLAVLERRGDTAMRLAMPDGATIGDGAGRLNLAAGTLVVDAETTQVATRSLDVVATRTEAHLGRVGLFAEAIETIAQRIIGRFRRSFRFVEEGEQLRARDIDQRASGHVNLKGETITVQGGALVKLRSDQIHLG